MNIEVAILGSPSLIVLTVSVDVNMCGIDNEVTPKKK